MASRVQRLWKRAAHALSWTTPTSTEIGVVVKSGLAAGIAWWVALVLTGVPDPILASLTAIVVVQVSVRASVRTALQRSAAVVLGVFVALAIGDALALNGFTVGLLVAVSLGVAQLVLHLPAAAARQLPVTVLIILTAVASTETISAERRAANTLIGAAIGVVISLLLPASRLADARETINRLATSLGEVLDTMGNGLQQPWSTDQTEEWRRTARTVRTRLVDQADEAVGNGREVARWNVRDRRHAVELGHFEDLMPRLERTAIGVSVISRGIDDHARVSGTVHRAMPAMGMLLIALASGLRAVVANVVDDAPDDRVATTLAEVRARRDRCAQGASRRARLALDNQEQPDYELEVEWLGYAALLVQVDRIVGDLSAPLPT